MVTSTPIVLVPGVLCSARLFSAQVMALWPYGQVAVADHRREADMATIAAGILAQAPPRFALAGLSMGGYIALAMMRLAPERVVKLALLDTNARSDTAEQMAGREQMIAKAQAGQLDEIVTSLLPRFLHKNRQNDETLIRVVRDMAAETGAEAFVHQQKAVKTRPDSRPLLKSIACPTLVLVGDGDTLTPPDLSQEMATAIPGAQLVVVPDCGHLSTIEKPDAVNAALVTWVAT